MINKTWALVTTSTLELSMPHGLVVWEGPGPGKRVGGGRLSKKSCPLGED